MRYPEADGAGTRDCALPGFGRVLAVFLLTLEVVAGISGLDFFLVPIAVLCKRIDDVTDTATAEPDFVVVEKRDSSGSVLIAEHREPRRLHDRKIFDIIGLFGTKVGRW